MKSPPLLARFLVLETLIQIAVEGYYVITKDADPLYGYLGFAVTAILLLVVAWLSARRANSIRSGVFAGTVFWIFATSLTLLFLLANYVGLFGSAVPTSNVEIKGYLLASILLTPVAVLVCWGVARFSKSRGSAT